METKPFEVGKTYLRVDGTPVKCVEIRQTEDGTQWGAKFDDFGDQSWRFNTPDMRGRRTGANKDSPLNVVPETAGSPSDFDEAIKLLQDIRDYGESVGKLNEINDFLARIGK